MMKYIVRMANRDEIKYLVSMGRRMHDNSAFRNMDYDEDRMAILGYTALDNPHRLFLMVIEDTEQEVPIGVLIAMLSQTYFGKDLVANDLSFMIEEEHRGRCGQAIRRITALYRDWAEQHNAKRIYLGTSTGIDPDKTRAVYEACGFHQIGTLHEA